MAETLISGRPPRVVFRDERIMGIREGYLKLGGKEEIRWLGNSIVLYWEVRTTQDRSGRSFPRPVYVVESTTPGGSKVMEFAIVEDADRYFADLEREWIVDIAAAALGVKP